MNRRTTTFWSGVILMPKSIEQLASEQVHKSELAGRHAVEAGKPVPGPVITISRGMGSGARIIAEKLAQDLGWSLWSKELLDTIAKDANVSRKIVESFDEKTVSEIEQFVRHLFGNHGIGGFIYTKHLVRAVATIAKLGNAIILGRGANIILPDALNIRIDASEERRISNMMKFEGLSHNEAAEKIRQSDRERRRFLVRTFGKKQVDSAHYDLSICMDEFTNDDAVEIIKSAIKAKCKAAEK